MPGGRPDDYDEDYPRQIELLIGEHGLTMEEIATVFSTSVSSLYRWRDQYPTFREAIVRGRDRKNTKTVEKNLLKRANGYRFNEVTKELKTVRDPVTGEYTEQLVPVKVVRKDRAPSVRAQKIWLKNRDPKRWPMENTVKVDTNEQLAEVMEKLASGLPE